MRKILLSILLILLFGFNISSNRPYAFGSVYTSLVGLNNETSQNSTTTGVSASNVGTDNLVVVFVAMDNRSTADGQTNDVTSVTDLAGNNYVKAGEYTNDLGGAASGATVACYYSVTTIAITTSTTWTINYSGNVTAKVISVRSTTKGAGTSIGVQSLQTASDDNQDPQSMAISGATSREYLWTRVIASETDGTGGTATTGYTAINVGASATGGSEKGHVNLWIERKVETATGTTSDPSATDATADRANILFGFYEFTLSLSRKGDMFHVFKP